MVLFALSVSLSLSFYPPLFSLFIIMIFYALRVVINWWSHKLNSSKMLYTSSLVLISQAPYKSKSNFAIYIVLYIISLLNAWNFKNVSFSIKTFKIHKAFIDQRFWNLEFSYLKHKTLNKRLKTHTCCSRQCHKSWYCY